MRNTPDGVRVVSGGWDGTIRLWDTHTGTQIGDDWLGHHGRVLSVAVVDTPDGVRVVSGGDDGTIRLWELRTGSVLSELPLLSSVHSVVGSGSQAFLGLGRGIAAADIGTQIGEHVARRRR